MNVCMKYQVLIGLILSLFTNAGFSQRVVDKSADNGFMVRQIPNSESAARSFFSQLNNYPDTIYATIFRPANCPRCDGFLNIIYSLLKKETDDPVGLIAVYPDSLASKAYIQRNDIKSDFTIFDTKEDFSKILSFSPGYLHVGYILKFNIKTGELIVGANADNVTGQFFKDLKIYNLRKDTMEFPGVHGNYHDWGKSIANQLTLSATYPINISDTTYKISEIIYQPIFHKNKLLWNDKLALSVAEFSINDSECVLRRIVEPDSLESSRFVNLPSSIYEKLLKSNQLKNMPLQPFIIDDDKYGVAYSLPDLWLDDNGSLNYRNKPCFIKKSFSDFGYSDLVPLEYDFEDVFYYPHFNMKWFGDDEVVVGVQRITWPMITDKNEYINSDENNPFCDSFYDHYSQPVLATYVSKTGKLARRFGSLPSFAKKTKTGYCFSDMVFDSWDGEIVYASAYDGNIVVSSIENIDCPDCNQYYKAFLLDESIFKIPDTSDYYSYNCNALAEPFLNRKIVDIKVDTRNIHSIVRNCTDAFERPELEKYEYVVINRVTGERKVFDFPISEDGERRIAYGLRRLENGGVNPFVISGLDNKWSIYEYSINQ